MDNQGMQMLSQHVLYGRAGSHACLSLSCRFFDADAHRVKEHRRCYKHYHGADHRPHAHSPGQGASLAADIRTGHVADIHPALPCLQRAQYAAVSLCDQMSSVLRHV